jgi:hypothetical protein
MKRTVPGTLLLILLIGSLVACIAKPGIDSAAAGTQTAVKATVNALGTALALQPTNTRTPVPPTPVTPTLTSTRTPKPTKTFTPLPTVVTPWNTCDVATLISETIGDNVVMDPGTGFVKSWILENSGTCAWDKDYRIVFESGDAMTDIVELQFLTGKKKVNPGDQIIISMNQISPMEPGEYLGFWKLANSQGYRFGLGGEGNAFWVKVNVAKPSSTIFKVQTAKAAAIPNNLHGSCGKNGFTITLMGTIKATKSGTVTYKWEGTDGAESEKTESVVFYGADTQEVFHTFKIYKGMHYGWARIKILTPNAITSEKTTFNIECMN